MATKEAAKEYNRRSFLITTTFFSMIALIIVAAVTPTDPVLMSIATALSISIAVPVSYTVTYIAGLDTGSLVGYQSSSRVLNSQTNESEIAVTYDWATGEMELMTDSVKLDDTKVIRRALLTYILVALVSGAVIGYGIAGGL